MKVKFALFVPLIFLTLSCIEKIDLKVPEGNKRLVVDGLITNEGGPCSIRLSYSSEYEKGEILPLIGARVSISDNGEIEELLEIQNGVYQTKKLEGVVGHTYTLYIETPDGKRFVSTPQLLKAAPAIEKLYFEPTEKRHVDEDFNEIITGGFQVFMDAEEPLPNGDFYRFEYQGIYEVITQPEDYTIIERDGSLLPAPKDCCKFCWIKEAAPSFVVKDDLLIDGKGIIKHPLVFIPYFKKVQIKYRVEGSLYSISREAHDFYKALNKQLYNTGTIFDPTPGRIKGNIYNPNDPKEIVLGLFTASGVSKRTLDIKRSSVPVLMESFIYPDDCRVLNSSTTLRPEGW